MLKFKLYLELKEKYYIISFYLFLIYTFILNYQI